MLLSVGVLEDDQVVARLNDWLRNDAPWNEPSVPPGATGVGFLTELSRGGPEGRGSMWGGWKYPECRLWEGAFNHADSDAVVERVATLTWSEPTNVQLLLKDQEQSYFRLWMFRGGGFEQFAPPPETDDDMSA